MWQIPGTAGFKSLITMENLSRSGGIIVILPLMGMVCLRFPVMAGNLPGLGALLLRLMVRSMWLTPGIFASRSLTEVETLSRSGKVRMVQIMETEGFTLLQGLGWRLMAQY